MTEWGWQWGLGGGGDGALGGGEGEGNGGGEMEEGTLRLVGVMMEGGRVWRWRRWGFGRCCGSGEGCGVDGQGGLQMARETEIFKVGVILGVVIGGGLGQQFVQLRATQRSRSRLRLGE